MRFPAFASLQFAVVVGLAVAPLPAASSDPLPFTWVTSTPEAEGVRAEPIQLMLDRIAAENLPIDGFVLVRNGAIVSERYFHGYTANSQHAMYSVTKSFTATALGIAIDQGLVSGVEAPVLGFFPAIEVQNLTANKQRMQLQHLLMMGSGHTSDTTSAITGTGDWVKAFLDLPLPAEPGSVFVYNSGASVVVSAVVQAATGTTTEDFARRTYLGPMGITNLTWDKGPNNLSIGGWGLYLTPRDMAKFGLMLLNRGKWAGERLVSRRWIGECSRKHISNGTSGYWGVGYGYQFWLNPFGGFRADGAGGQLIFVLPDHNTVAVFTSQYVGAPVPVAFDLMSQYVVPAVGAGAETHVAEWGPPMIVDQPRSVSVGAGGEALFCVEARGPELSYQWFHGNAAIDGATRAALRVAAVGAADAGRYSVRVSGAFGSVQSEEAELAVDPAQHGSRITGLSARADAASGEGALVAGLSIGDGGDGVSLPVMLRGAGPALAAFGLTGVMTDPVATLFTVGVEGARSDDWDDDPLVATEAVRLGNFAFGAGSLDAAMLRVLPPGLHTLSVGPLTPDRHGVVLAECYDASDRPTARTPRLKGLSARARVTAGEGALIGGFALEGGESRTLVIRAVGPTLASFGIGAPLPDPVLRIYRGSEVVASNDDWAGDSALTAAFARVGEFALPAGSRDAALVVTLPAGLYTAVVEGKDGAAGVALLEIYVLP